MTVNSDSGGRREDFRLLTGGGRYTDDLATPGGAFAVFWRAPVAAGRIRALDVAAARGAPGVLAVLTGAEAEADGLGPIPTLAALKSRDGSPLREGPRPVLPAAHVHHVGQPLAAVIAETQAAARDALELIDADIEETPPALDCAAEPVIHPGIADNIAFDWEAGDYDAAMRALAAAPHRVEMAFRQNRMVGAALEGRVAVAEYIAEGPSVTLHLACQGANIAHDLIANRALRWPPERLRVRTGDVGGGFGPKFFIYPEQAIVAWACWRLRRAVRWASERSESFVSETHARDQWMKAALGFDDQGRFLAIAMSADADMGAFLSTFAPGIPTDGLAKVVSGLYDIPEGGLRVRGVYSNTMPVDAYRGAGKPPGIYCLERLVDLAAARLDMDRAEIRRRNLIRPEALPQRTALGHMLDGGGDFPAALARSLATIGWTEAAARRAAAAREGRYLGVGLACNLHPVGGIPTETARIHISADGRVAAFTGTQATGQGHETVLAQVIARRLQLPAARIAVLQGDTAQIAQGGGSGGSSSMVISGATLARTADAALNLARARAAERLEAAGDDLEYAAGRFTIAGTDRRVSLFELAEDEPIEARHDFADSTAAWSYGVTAAEVEIDPETGALRLARLLSVDDAGPLINRQLTEGQAQGALAQGAGQALLERMVHDPASGQVLTGSFMDYALARADDLPMIGTEFLETASSSNILGVRGIGELGTNGAPAAIANAVFDALSAVGIAPDALSPPFTAARIWRAMHGND